MENSQPGISVTRMKSFISDSVRNGDRIYFAGATASEEGAAGEESHQDSGNRSG